MKRFTMNNKEYETDEKTLRVLRDAVRTYKKSEAKDVTPITAVMGLGLKSGRIKEVTYDYVLTDGIYDYKKKTMTKGEAEIANIHAKQTTGGNVWWQKVESLWDIVQDLEREGHISY